MKVDEWKKSNQGVNIYFKAYKRKTRKKAVNKVNIVMMTFRIWATIIASY